MQKVHHWRFAEVLHVTLNFFLYMAVTPGQLINKQTNKQKATEPGWYYDFTEDCWKYLGQLKLNIYLFWKWLRHRDNLSERDSRYFWTRETKNWNVW